VQTIERGDLNAINALLSEDAILLGDGGGKVQSSPKPMAGGRRIAQLFYASHLRFGTGMRFKLVLLNGQWALLRYFNGQLESAQSFETDGDHIARIHVQRNPDKLVRIAAVHGNG